MLLLSVPIPCVHMMSWTIMLLVRMYQQRTWKEQMSLTIGRSSPQSQTLREFGKEEKTLAG